MAECGLGEEETARLGRSDHPSSGCRVVCVDALFLLHRKVKQLLRRFEQKASASVPTARSGFYLNSLCEDGPRSAAFHPLAVLVRTSFLLSFAI